MIFKKRIDPEDETRLAQLTPKRYYTRAEVDALMWDIQGLVSDGLLITGYIVKEMPLWFEVSVSFDDPNAKDSEETYETWRFYKHERSQI